METFVLIKNLRLLFFLVLFIPGAILAAIIDTSKLQQEELMKKELLNAFYTLSPEIKESLGQEFVDEVSRQTHSIFTLFPSLPTELQQEILKQAGKISSIEIKDTAKIQDKTNFKTALCISLTSKQFYGSVRKIIKEPKLIAKASKPRPMFAKSHYEADYALREAINESMDLDTIQTIIDLKADVNCIADYYNYSLSEEQRNEVRKNYSQEFTAPIHFAALRDRDDIIRLLYTSNADLHKENNLAGLLPLHLAAQHGKCKATEALIECQADVNRLNSHKVVTPVNLASYAGHTDIVKILLDAKANISYTLHNATNNQHKEMVKFLIGEKADVNEIADGKSPLDGAYYFYIFNTYKNEAKKKIAKEIIQLLEDAGGNRVDRSRY